MMDAQLTEKQPALSIEHIAVHFGGLVAISDMNFVVTEGEVRYRGTSLSNLKPHQVTSLSLVRTFQRTSVFQSVSVFENVMIGLHRRGRSTIMDTLFALPRER